MWNSVRLAWFYNQCIYTLTVFISIGKLRSKLILLNQGPFHNPNGDYEIISDMGIRNCDVHR